MVASRGRRLGAWIRLALLQAVLLVLSFVAVEAGYRVWLRARGQPYGAHQTDEAIRQAVAAVQDPMAGTQVGEPLPPLFLHFTGPQPYYTYDAPDGGSRRVAKLQEILGSKRPDQYNVVIVGGSVAGLIAV